MSDYSDDEDYGRNDIEKLVTKSNVGCMKTLLNELFCYKWTIPNIFQNIEIGKATCFQSPEFKTGGNALILKLIVSEKYSRLQIDVQVDLISCKEPVTVDFRLALLDYTGKGVKNKVETILDISKCHEGKMISKFNNLILNENLYITNTRIPVSTLTLSCEIIKPSPKTKITKHNKTDELKLFLKNQKLSDVTVSVGKTKFHLHKAILASRSAVFLAMFERDTKENTENLVEITDVDEKIMKKVILFIYTDEIENLEEDAIDIFAVADKYRIEGLRSACIKELNNSLDSNNVFHLLVLADIYSAEELKINALNYIAANITELIGTQGYQILQKEYLHLTEQILQSTVKRLQYS